MPGKVCLNCSATSFLWSCVHCNPLLSILHSHRLENFSAWPKPESVCTKSKASALKQYKAKLKRIFWANVYTYYQKWLLSLCISCISILTLGFKSVRKNMNWKLFHQIQFGILLNISCPEILVSNNSKGKKMVSRDQTLLTWKQECGMCRENREIHQNVSRGYL